MLLSPVREDEYPGIRIPLRIPGAGRRGHGAEFAVLEEG